MKPRSLLILLLIAMLAYIFYLHFEHADDVALGVQAPRIVLSTKGGTVSLDEYKGKVVLLNFWATWCPPCVAEMPSLERLHQRLAGQDFEILAVNEDDEGWVAVARFLQQIPLTMPILIDPRGYAAAQYGSDQLPETFLIDKKGVIVRKYSGARDWTDERIVTEIQRLIIEGS